MHGEATKTTNGEYKREGNVPSITIYQMLPRDFG